MSAFRWLSADVNVTYDATCLYGEHTRSVCSPLKHHAINTHVNPDAAFQGSKRGQFPLSQSIRNYGVVYKSRSLTRQNRQINRQYTELGQVWGHTAEQRVAASTLRRYSVWPLPRQTPCTPANFFHACSGFRLGLGLGIF